MKKMSEQDLFDAIGNIDNKYIKNAETSDESDAHAAPAEITDSYPQNGSPFSLSSETDDADAPVIVPSRASKTSAKAITALLAVAAVILSFIAGAYAYRAFNKPGDTKDPSGNDIANIATETTTAFEVAIADTTAALANTTPTEPIVTPTDVAVGTEKLTIPENISKIVIQRGDLGTSFYDTLTFEDTKTLEDIIAKLGEISGEKKKYTAKLEQAIGSGQYSFALHCSSGKYYDASYYFFSDTTILESNRAGYRAIEVNAPISVLPYITSKLNNPEFVPDSPFDWANTHYLIIEVGEPTEKWFTSSELSSKYVEVTCKVLYGNITDIAISVSQPGYTWHVPVYNIQSFYIPEEKVDEITSHDVILVRRARFIDRHSFDFSHLQGEFCIIGYDENDTPEYLAFDDGRLSFPESNSSECLRSFASLYALNEEVDRLMNRDPQPGDIPRRKITDGMTMQEVIDYFDAFQAWAAMQVQP